MTTSPKTAPKPANPTQSLPTGKLGEIIRLLQRNRGATINDMVDATGWQAHSVRGAISGPLKKRHGLAITASTDESRGRVYRLGKIPKAGSSK